tara:strand:+ start:326 stop:700 length:375 start_codon:yes stop_codon:yes gene_type:complete
MMLPNTFDVTPFTLGNLKPRQRSFVAFLYENGHTNADEVVFKRNYLKNIAQAWGAEWAPAWIVKDMSRVTTRGFYAIPELTELINETSDDEDVVVETDFIEDNPQSDVDQQVMDELVETSQHHA